MLNITQNKASEMKILSTPKDIGVLVPKALKERFVTSTTVNKNGDVDTSQFLDLLFLVLKENVKEKEEKAAN